VEFHLVKTLVAEAAHKNPRGGEKQQRLHGHSYRIDVLAKGAPDSTVGWIVDFAELKAALNPIYADHDHGYLNELPGFGDEVTVQAVGRWIAERLAPHPHWYAGVRVKIVGDCAFQPVRLPADGFENLPARIRFSFEAAQSLPQLPSDHPCHCIHGHSYFIEVGAENLDSLEPHLESLYDTLDHRYLNDIPGLEASTVEYIAVWIWRFLADAGAQPTVVAVQETPASRCLYFGE